MSNTDQSPKTKDQNTTPLRAAILSPEAVPFAKVGGLADVSGALPKALHTEGVDSFLILPLYDQIDRSLLTGPLIEDLEVLWRGKQPRISVWKSDALKAPAYLIDAPYYFAREKIYGDSDDFERFAFFCRTAIALLKRLGDAPDVLHCNDWPCGFAAKSRRPAWLLATRTSTRSPIPVTATPPSTSGS